MSDDFENNDDQKKAIMLDMAQAEQIAFYQDTPIIGPASFQEAVQSKSRFAQRIPGTSEWTIGNGVGSLGQLTLEEIEEKKNEEATEWFEQAFEDVERAREEERKREEWSREEHSYAGIEMTGEEWGEFADQLKGDTPLRKWLLERLKKEGKTDAQANDLVNQMSLLAKMQSIPQDQWTDEMKALNAKLDADPALREKLNRDLKEAKQYEADAKVNGQKVELNADVAKADMAASTEAGADILSQGSGAASVEISTPNSFASTIDGPAIASGLDLSEHHKAALAAKEPLDAPKQVAAFTPPSGPAPTSPGGGFDV